MKSPKCAPNSTPSNSSSSRKVQLAIGKYLSQLGWLDPRSLACFRLILSLVLLYDIGQSWTLIDDWVGLQGYYDGLPLPGLIGIRGSWIGITDETTLRLIFSVYAVSVLGLLVGYKTSWCTIWVWVASCGHHYAASHTLDYHDTAIVNLLLWSLALPLGDRFSVDAVLRRKAGHRFTRSPKDITPAPKDITPARQLRQRRLVEAVAGCGFVLTLAWLYLNTAAAKDGAAWWSQGDAVRLAVMEFSARAPEGVWAIAHLPDLFFRVATHVVLVVEWVVPFLLLSPWKRSVLRTACCATLIGLHVVMWLLLDIGSFPPTMIAAAAALLPTTFWTYLTGTTKQGAPVVAPLNRRNSFAQYLLIAFFGLSVLVNIEGTRLRALDPDRYPSYPGARLLLRLKCLLGVESMWSMYAPEPQRYGGWWVAAGRRRNGNQVDLITGNEPTLSMPFPRSGSHTGPLGYYWSQPPNAHTAAAYLRFLRWRNQHLAGNDEELIDLHLIYVYERYEFSSQNNRSAPRQYPLSMLNWSAGGHASPAIGEAWTLYRAEPNRLGDPDWQPARLERERPSP